MCHVDTFGVPLKDQWLCTCVCIYIVNRNFEKCTNPSSLVWAYLLSFSFHLFFVSDRVEGDFYFQSGGSEYHYKNVRPRKFPCTSFNCHPKNVNVALQ